ncbi:MAG: nucleoside triphosphate pyrophosphohydrolase family protein [Ignavibacteria bacterium]|nr:nucleoside triphosphate pyrophosphohydrolase family protein [Ignavibacteria bacterium]
MNFSEYQAFTVTTAKYPTDYDPKNFGGLLTALSAAGIICERTKKTLRDKEGKVTEETREVISRQVQRAGEGFTDFSRQIATEISANRGAGTGNTVLGAALYPLLGLFGETGELLDKIIQSPEAKDAIMKEMGDVLYYISELARQLDLNLDEIAVTNKEKLTQRKEKGLIHGEGDNRGE